MAMPTKVWTGDELGRSQLADAPQPTQASSGGGRPRRNTRPIDRYTPGTFALGGGKGEGKRRGRQ